MSKPPSIHDLERTIELDFVRATEAAALNVFKWIGKGEKNKTIHNLKEKTIRLSSDKKEHRL